MNTHTHALLTLCDITASSDPRSVSRPEAFCSSSPVLVHALCIRLPPAKGLYALAALHMMCVPVCTIHVQPALYGRVHAVCRATYMQKQINNLSGKEAYGENKIDDRRYRHDIHSFYVSVCLFIMHGHMSTTPTLPPIPWGLSHVLCAPVPPSLHHCPADQPRNAWFNSLRCAGPSITDPMVRDMVLSCRKGWQINLNPDWWAGMRLSGLVWGQHREVEKAVTINRSRHLQWGDSGSAVILSGVKLCLGQSREVQIVINSDKL